MFQIKASAKTLASGSRQFQSPHHQLVALQEAATEPGQDFYVLPTIGMSNELERIRFALIPNLRFVDLHEVPPLDPPTTSKGTLRKRGIHYLNLNDASDWVTIHSEPVTARALPLASLLQRLQQRSPEQRTDVAFRTSEDRRRDTEDAHRFVRGARHRVAAFIPLAG